MAQRLGHPGPFAPAPKLAEPNLSQQKLDAVEPFAVKQVEQKTQPKPVEAETPTKNIEHESSSEHAEADSRAKDVQKSTATKLNEPARATSSTTAPTPDAYPSSVTPTSVTSPAVPSLPSMPSLPSLTSDEPVLKGSKQLPPKKVQSVVTEPTSLGQPLKTLEAPTLTPPSNINSRIIDPSDDPELAPQAEKYVQPTQTVQQPTQIIPPAPAQVTQPVQSAPQQLQQPAPVAQPVVQQPAPAPAAPATPVATPPTATAPAQPEPERKPTAATTPTDSSQLLEPAHESYWLGSDTINIMKSLSKPNGK